MIIPNAAECLELDRRLYANIGKLLKGQVPELSIRSCGNLHILLTREGFYRQLRWIADEGKMALYSHLSTAFNELGRHPLYPVEADNSGHMSGHWEGARGDARREFLRRLRAHLAQRHVQGTLL